VGIAALRRWTLQDAKNRFSELVRYVFSDGPQVVTRGGSDAVVVLSATEYERLTGPAESLLAFLQASPLARVDLPIDRPSETGRSVEF
jgi:prevent-host-death family protein